MSKIKVDQLQDLLRSAKRGGDRVGLVIACYRMAHDGWTNEQAFQEASDLGLSRWEVLMRRYIRGFNPSRVR
jgi:hypothetical protein